MLVRVMNLHKAKGLEAPVVFLANPLSGVKPRVAERLLSRIKVGEIETAITVGAFSFAFAKR